MKITYKFVTGEVVEIDVPEAFAKISATIDRDIYNNNRRETRRHYSIDAMQEEGLQTIDLSIDIEAAVEEQEMSQDLHKALMELLPQQRELIHKIFYEGMSIAQIARDDGVSESAIRDRINRIYKKLKKYLT